MTTPRSDLPLVLRRRRSTALYLLLTVVLLLTLGGLLLAQGRQVTALLAVAGAGLVGWGLPAWLRARTELRPDGVWNRTVRSGELTAWPDIAQAMSSDAAGTIVLLRHGGGTVQLAGVLGARTSEEPGLDEILAVIESHLDPDRPAHRTPAVIERRLSMRPARSFIVVLAGIGVLCCLLAPGSVLLFVPGAFFLAGSGFLAAATARARTRIGPDGVHNRALRREVFIPWSDMAEVTVSATPPRTVRIVRHGDAWTTLAAVRASEVHADGLGPGDIADVIRERAGLVGARPEVGEARPLSLRPSRRPLLWTVPLSVALTAGWAVWLSGRPSEPLLIVPVYLVMLTVRLLRGRTDAGPGGLRDRSIRTTTELAWEDVDRFTIAPTMFGRVVRVVTRSGKRVTLAAPRDGLLGRQAGLEESVATMRALAARRREGPPELRRISAGGSRAVWACSLILIVALGAGLWGLR